MFQIISFSSLTAINLQPDVQDDFQEQFHYVFEVMLEEGESVTCLNFGNAEEQQSPDVNKQTTGSSSSGQPETATTQNTTSTGTNSTSSFFSSWGNRETFSNSQNSTGNRFLDMFGGI